MSGFFILLFIFLIITQILNCIFMKLEKGIIITLFVGLFAHTLFAQKSSWVLKSPDNMVCFAVECNSDNSLTYSVNYDNKQAIESSPLGLVLDEEVIGRKPKFISASKVKYVNDPYELIAGKQLRTNDNCNEMVLSFKSSNGLLFDIVMRAYDDGAAFRYNINGAMGSKSYNVSQELTEFQLPKNGKSFNFPYNWDERNKPCYEEWCEYGSPINTSNEEKRGWAFPLLFETNQLWIMVTEAHIDGNYPACHIDNSGINGGYKIRFPESDEVIYPLEPSGAISNLPLATPWRCIVVGNDLNTIFKTQMVTHLNPPSIVQDASWIKAGRSSWSWWFEKKVKSYQRQIAYVDLSAEMGWEYILIDAGWPNMKDGGSMENVVEYAKNKGVGVWIWYPSCAGSEDKPEAKNCIMQDSDLRKKELSRISKIGVKGIKVDFFDTDKQKAMKLYLDILNDAVDCKLMVDFHGSTLPRGWERTYPNLLSMESVSGAEGMGNQLRCDKAPRHHAVLPFTRNVVGSMDYTPVTFSVKNPGSKTPGIPKTSYAHQLALSVVFESAFQCFADNDQMYLSLPEKPKEFLKEVPASWDESQLLCGYPGDYLVVARRKGDAWYIAGINGLDQKRKITFTLPQQCAGKSFSIISDGQDEKSFGYQTMASKDRVISIEMLANGGFAGVVK